MAATEDYYSCSESCDTDSTFVPSNSEEEDEENLPKSRSSNWSRRYMGGGRVLKSSAKNLEGTEIPASIHNKSKNKLQKNNNETKDENNEEICGHCDKVFPDIESLSMHLLEVEKAEECEEKSKKKDKSRKPYIEENYEIEEDVVNKNVDETHKLNHKEIEKDLRKRNFRFVCTICHVAFVNYKAAMLHRLETHFDMKSKHIIEKVSRKKATYQKIGPKNDGLDYKTKLCDKDFNPFFGEVLFKRQRKFNATISKSDSAASTDIPAKITEDATLIKSTYNQDTIMADYNKKTDNIEDEYNKITSISTNQDKMETDNIKQLYLPFLNIDDNEDRRNSASPTILKEVSIAPKSLFEAKEERKQKKHGIDASNVSHSSISKTMFEVPVKVRDIESNTIKVKSNKATLYKCNDCAVHFVQKQDLVKHTKEMIHNLSVIVKCPFCKLDFIRGKLTEHVKEHHHKSKLGKDDFIILTSNNIAVNAVNNDKANAQICVPSIFNDSIKLDHAFKCVDKEIELGNASYNCGICLESFKIQSHLQEHIIKQNCKPKILTCNICGLYLNVESLVYHMERHGKKEIKQNSTGEAEKNFVNTNIFVGGTKTISAVCKKSKNRRTLFKCGICSAHFVSLEALNCHMQFENHERMEKLICTKCGLIFNVQNLTRHEEEHHNDLCNLTFDDFDITRVPLNESKYKTTIIRDDGSETHVGKCPHCCVHFVTETSLLKHLDANLYNSETIICKMCGLEFTSSEFALHFNLHCTRSFKESSEINKVKVDDSSKSRLKEVNKTKDLKRVKFKKLMRDFDTMNSKKHSVQLLKCKSCKKLYLRKAIMHNLLQKATCSCDERLENVTLMHSFCDLDEINMAQVSILSTKNASNNASYEQRKTTANSTIENKKVEVGTQVNIKFYETNSSKQDYPESSSEDENKGKIKIHICKDCNVCYLSEQTCLDHVRKHTPLDTSTYSKCEECGLQFQFRSLEIHRRIQHKIGFDLENVVFIEYKFRKGLGIVKKYRAAKAISKENVNLTLDDNKVSDVIVETTNHYRNLNVNNQRLVETNNLNKDLNVLELRTESNTETNTNINVIKSEALANRISHHSLLDTASCELDQVVSPSVGGPTQAALTSGSTPLKNQFASTTSGSPVYVPHPLTDSTTFNRSKIPDSEDFNLSQMHVRKSNIKLLQCVKCKVYFFRNVSESPDSLCKKCETVNKSLTSTANPVLVESECVNRTNTPRSPTIINYKIDNRNINNDIANKFLNVSRSHMNDILNTLNRDTRSTLDNNERKSLCVMDSPDHKKQRSLINILGLEEQKSGEKNDAKTVLGCKISALGSHVSLPSEIINRLRNLRQQAQQQPIASPTIIDNLKEHETDNNIMKENSNPSVKNNSMVETKQQSSASSTGVVDKLEEPEHDTIANENILMQDIQDIFAFFKSTEEALQQITPFPINIDQSKEAKIYTHENLMKEGLKNFGEKESLKIQQSTTASPTCVNKAKESNSDTIADENNLVKENNEVYVVNESIKETRQKINASSTNVDQLKEPKISTIPNKNYLMKDYDKNFRENMPRLRNQQQSTASSARFDKSKEFKFNVIATVKNLKKQNYTNVPVKKSGVDTQNNAVSIKTENCMETVIKTKSDIKTELDTEMESDIKKEKDIKILDDSDCEIVESDVDKKPKIKIENDASSVSNTISIVLPDRNTKSVDGKPKKRKEIFIVLQDNEVKRIKLSNIEINLDEGKGTGRTSKSIENVRIKEESVIEVEDSSDTESSKTLISKPLQISDTNSDKSKASEIHIKLENGVKTEEENVKNIDFIKKENDCHGEKTNISDTCRRKQGTRASVEKSNNMPNCNNRLKKIETAKFDPKAAKDLLSNVKLEYDDDVIFIQD